jgi:hypothetical protein
MLFEFLMENHSHYLFHFTEAGDKETVDSILAPYPDLKKLPLDVFMKMMDLLGNSIAFIMVAEKLNDCLRYTNQIGQKFHDFDLFLE